MSAKPVSEAIPVHIYSDGGPSFLVKVMEKNEAFVTGYVEEVCSWEADGTAGDTTPYLSFMIKWDGCSHLDFGRVDEKEHRDGYVHLCGGDGWTSHIRLMKWLFEWAEKEIPMDTSISGTLEA